MFPHFSALFLLACFPEYPADLAQTFHENPNHDYDGDGYTDSEGDCDDRDPNISSPPTWYEYSDGDGFGNPDVTQQGCERPDGFVANGDDCNDSYDSVFPNSALNEPEGTCAFDEDGDGYGSRNPSVSADPGSDCDDTSAFVYPGSNQESGVVCVFDGDGDGYGDTQPPAGYDVGTDCNDNAADANPTGFEICDDLDNDCNGTVDDSAKDANTWFYDADGDGYGSANSTTKACGTEPPDGFANNNFDCDDLDESVAPNAPEICDYIDNNCDGEIDIGVKSLFFLDADSDGYGDLTTSIYDCEAPESYVDNSDDCDDADPLQNPVSDEYCNGEDDNCDGYTDEDDAIDATLWFLDNDNDTFGNNTVTMLQCYQPSGYVADNTDCNDAALLIYPGAVEFCDGKDNNCNGTIDDNALGKRTFFLDVDGDGDGTPLTTLDACPVFNSTTQQPEPPSGYAWTNGDCDDSASSISSLQPELCTGSIDENCDGHNTLGATDVESWYADSDGDSFGNGSYIVETCTMPQGYTDNALDCDDNDGALFPGNPELCNGKLDDCNMAEDLDGDGVLDYEMRAEEADLDQDGYIQCTYDASSWVTTNVPAGGGDCQDNDDDVFPGAPELCTGEVEDCNSPDYGTTPPDEFDDDGDGYVECTGFISVGWEGSSSVIGGADCDDSNEYTFPGAAQNIADPTFCVQDADDDGNPDCVRWPTNADQVGPTDYFCDYGVFLTDTVGPDFVLISAGDDPVGRYTLTTDFYMMTTEVTNAMYDALVGTGESNDYPVSYGHDYSYPFTNLTVVSWYEAAAYANLLSDEAGLTPCYDENNNYAEVADYRGRDIILCPGYRLPTEAEWEYAARSGTAWDMWTAAGGGEMNPTSQSANYCESTLEIEDGSANPLLTEYAWFCANNNPDGFKQVAQLKPNGFGLYDMVGNASEWIHDWDGGSFPYQNTSTDPVGPLVGTEKVLRGGNFSWTTYPYNLISVRWRETDSLDDNEARLDYFGTENDTFFGFRLVRSSP
ncbi:MAG: MopE-related protein [Myxococcota bacterium]|nr:MopE-related protein [Myxococcota bacterium]